MFTPADLQVMRDRISACARCGPRFDGGYLRRRTGHYGGKRPQPVPDPERDALAYRAFGGGSPVVFLSRFARRWITGIHCF